MKKFFNIKNDDEKTIIDIDGIIGVPSEIYGSEDSKNTKYEIRDFLNQLEKTQTKNILVRLSSLGGSVDHGLVIHDSLKNHPASIEVELYGMNASASTIISQAADEGKLKMSKNSMFLIHEAWNFFLSNKTEMKNHLNTLEKIDDIIVDIYSNRSGKNRKEIEKLMAEDNGNGKWLNAEEAKEFGLIDEIFHLKDLAESNNERDAENYRNIVINEYAAMIKTQNKIFLERIQNHDNKKGEKNMDNEKIYTAHDFEAAKEEIFRNVSKHLAYIDKADNVTVVENISKNAKFEDCVEEYSDQKIKKALAESRDKEMTPENLDFHDAKNEIDNNIGYEKKSSSIEAAKQLGLIK